MTDIDLLTGTIAARIRLLPGVTRLYPARTGLDAVGRTISGLLDAVADDPAVALRPVGDGYVVEVSVGITDGAAAPLVGAEIHRTIRDACHRDGLAVRRSRVRVATVD